jgi:hypothetical protein
MSREASSSEAGPDASQPSQAGSEDRTEDQASRPAQIGSQFSGALLRLSVPDTSDSGTAPDTPLPATSTVMATLAAYTEFALAAPAASQAPGNDAAGSASDEATDSRERNPAANMGGQSTYGRNASATASSTRKPAATQSHMAFTPLPVIPKWHMRPRMRTN